MSDYWLSTKSPPGMWRPDYQDARLATALKEAKGVDPAILSSELHVSAPCIRAYQRKLGVRPLSNPRKAKCEF